MAKPPKSVMKINKKDGVTFTSSVDYASYTLHELSRAALKDVGKYVTREARQNVKRVTGRGARNVQYWVRHRQPEPELQVGIKPGGFYIGFQELGSRNTPKVGALQNAVHDNIPMIIKIQSQYLSAMSDLDSAQSLIDESEEEGNDE